ncbi:MAG: hypothetical protein ACYCWE_03050 [Eubacteriales bacterium]
MVMQKSVLKKKSLDISHGQQVMVYDEYRVNQNIVLRYLSVCTPDFKVFGADVNNNVYSALIILNENGVDIETKFIYDIARNGEESYRIMKLLSDNGVTPDTAVEILDELL